MAFNYNTECYTDVQKKDTVTETGINEDTRETETARKPSDSEICFIFLYSSLSTDSFLREKSVN